MSVTQKGQKEKITGVRVSKTNTNVFYLWYHKDYASVAGVTAADLQALGHFSGEVAAAPGIIFFLNANAPKPPRFKKDLTKGGTVTRAATEPDSISSFGSVVSDFPALLAAGWKLSDRYIGINEGNTGKGLWVAAELSNGGIYEFYMNQAYFDTYASVLALRAVKLLTDADKQKICAGSTTPKAQGVVKTRGTPKNIKAFASHNAPLSDEWKIETPEIISLAGI